jgi:hypothetical protein
MGISSFASTLKGALEDEETLLSLPKFPSVLPLEPSGPA